MVEYDPSTGVHTSYTFPIVTEPGGPIAADDRGRIVVGTRGSQGYVMVFDPPTQTFQAFQLPTSVMGNMNDGLSIGPHGEVWFTESVANKIARLLIP